MNKKLIARIVLLAALIAFAVWTVKKRSKRVEEYAFKLGELKDHVAKASKLDVGKIALGVARLEPKDRKDISRAQDLARKGDRRGLLRLIDRNARGVQARPRPRPRPRPRRRPRPRPRRVPRGGGQRR